MTQPTVTNEEQVSAPTRADGVRSQVENNVRFGSKPTSDESHPMTAVRDQNRRSPQGSTNRLAERLLSGTERSPNRRRMV